MSFLLLQSGGSGQNHLLLQIGDDLLLQDSVAEAPASGLSIGLAVDLPKVLRALLIGDAGVNEIVRGAVMVLGTFIEYTVPCIIIKLLGGDTNSCLDGNEDEQYPTALLEVYAHDYQKAKDLFDLVVTRLVNVQQLTIAGHLVASIRRSHPEDRDEPLLVGQTLPDFVFATNVQAWLSRVEE